MNTTTGYGFTMSLARLQAVADLLQRPLRRVQAACLYDWPAGEEHQRWLDTAPLPEIADWAAEILQGEDQADTDVLDPAFWA